MGIAAGLVSYARNARPHWRRRSNTAGELAESHYENFHVASWFLPKRLRPHFHSIYAYCRISDDLGDEVGNHAQALALLDVWQEQLDACYRGEARHPVFVALRETIRTCDIPKEPFADLLTAFRQDQTVTRYASMGDVLAILPLLGQSRRPAGAVCVRLPRRGTVSRFPMRPALRCNLRISGRTFVRISRAGAFIFRRTRCGGRRGRGDDRERHGHAGSFAR